MRQLQIILFFSLIVNALGIAQNSNNKYQIYIDIAHKQRFWNDPADMNGMDKNSVNRVKYMTDEITKNAKSNNAGLAYLKQEIKPEDLSHCDLLFIHIPSAKYSEGEIKAIQNYIKKGGSLFLVMDADYWSTLEQTNVNEIIRPFGIQFGTDSQDTIVGGYSKGGIICSKTLKIPYHGARIINGGKPFCFNLQGETHPFGTFTELKNGGKIIVMGDGMVSLYMTSWQGVTDYQCSGFMEDVFRWLLKRA
jgi:hypothetical protein